MYRTLIAILALIGPFTSLTILVLLVPLVGSCGHRPVSGPQPEVEYRLPRGDDWDSFRGSWKLTGLITEWGTNLSEGGMNVSTFLRISGVRVNAETIRLELLDDPPAFHYVYHVVSREHPIGLLLQPEGEGTASGLGAIARGSGSELVICFSRLTVPVGGASVGPFPTRKRSER